MFPRSISWILFISASIFNNALNEDIKQASYLGQNGVFYKYASRLIDQSDVYWEAKFIKKVLKLLIYF